ncbi:MAG: ATP-dependent helicase, partial [Saprospiraceae bacterium]
MTTLNDTFRSLLDSLNPGQHRAVEHIEGPVLVIAGPGTGKTHILAARVGKILLETDARPQNILCLTFTDAGVNAMRTRLLDMIGPDAYRVSISTFHGFCNRVIQENMEYFGHGTLEPVSDLERIEIVRRLLADLPPEHPLREGRKNAFAYENHLRDLFATMKKEDWTPGLVLKTADDFVRGLPENPYFIYQRNTATARKGDPKIEIIANTTERMERLRAAADLYPKYIHAMEHTGRYEYEDMILWVLRAFKKHEALLRTYQERYLYVQVDEFQDTNGAQYHLLRLLLEFWDTPNAFIVGDDDQSIYEFQGARLGNLLDFHNRYRAALQTVVLSENYRSTQGILDTAALVIEKNTLRAVSQLDEPLEKNLRAATEETGTLHVRSYQNRLCELADVAGQIADLVRAGT